MAELERNKRGTDATVAAASTHHSGVVLVLVDQIFFRF